MSSQYPLARHPAGHAPRRRPGSIRRTSTIDTSWPDGFGKPMLIEAQARDLATPVGGGTPTVLAAASYRIVASPAREILSIAVWPHRPEAQQLVGLRGGSRSRAALATALARDRAAGAALYLILDDFAGASLVSGWIWPHWIGDKQRRADTAGFLATAGRGGNMAGVCIGFAPDSTALAEDGRNAHADRSFTVVPALADPTDPKGWHALATQSGAGARRARRIDVWCEGDCMAIETAFQDSGTMPGGSDRIAIHEYLVAARADGGVITHLSVDPRILPFHECPGAVVNAQRIVGTPLGDLRTRVLELLPGTAGCTHLNDVLRALADVPRLAETLPV